jgi:serine/threonine protein phosphatase PrpC
MMNVHSVSLIGRRPQNEDTHNIILNINNKNETMNNINFYAVFDGHGGKQVSQYLSEKLYPYFMEKKIQYPVKKDYVYTVFDLIQTNLKGNKYAVEAGSTCLVVIQYKKNNNFFLNIFNVGDSRCVLCRDNFGLPLTKDHKPNWPEEQHRIELLGGDIVNDGDDWRINRLSVSRAFGDLDTTPFISHKPDIFRYQIDKKNDKFLVIACDGVWDVLSNQDVVNFILSNCYDKTLKTRINKDFNIAHQLAEYAINRGSFDNITIIIIFMD